MKRATGVRWVADLRDPLAGHPHRDISRLLVSAKEQGQQGVAALVARNADAIVAVSEAITRRCCARAPRGPVVTIAKRRRLRRLRRASLRPAERFRITHAGSFFGQRDPRPFLTALARVDGVLARFVGDFRTADRDWAAGMRTVSS